jgi:predicted outer membrane repeat protein
MNRWIRAILAALLALPVLTFSRPALPAAAADYPCTEAGLISAVSTGGAATITCAAPTTVSLNATLTIAKDVQIDGVGNLTLQPAGGATDIGAFVVNAGHTLALSNLTIKDFQHLSGLLGAAVTVPATGGFSATNVTFTNNDVGCITPTVAKGGAISNAGTMTVTNSVFTASSACHGGAVYSTGSLSVSSTTFQGNSAQYGGGAIETVGTGSLAITGSTFRGNTAGSAVAPTIPSAAGGALLINNGATISASAFYTNAVSSYNQGASLSAGGAIMMTGTVSISGTLFSENSVVTLGGRNAAGMQEGVAEASGGGIYIGLSTPATLTLTNTQWYSNTAIATGEIGLTAAGSAQAQGGAIINRNFSAPMSIRSSTFYSNTVTATGGNAQPAGTGMPGNALAEGGGIFSYSGNARVENSTFADNRVASTTSTGNATANPTSTASGGGVNLGGAARMSFLFATITGNRAESIVLGASGVRSAGGGGVAAAAAGGPTAILTGTVFLGNSVISTTTTIGSCSGPPAELASGGFNVADDATCDLSAGTDKPNRTSAAINLGPLQNNGGFSLTRSPLAGSILIDNGATLATGCPATDQRGVTRPKGVSCDTGAVEVAPALPAPTITSLDPASATAGGPAFTLRVLGTNFANGTVVLFNGAPKTTTFISTTELQAAISAADIAAAGVAPVVAQQAPIDGGAASGPANFTITSPPAPLNYLFIPAAMVNASSQ